MMPMMSQSSSTVVPLNDQIISCGLVEDIIAEIGAQRIITKRRAEFSTSYEDVHQNRELAKAAAAYLLGSPDVITQIGNASIHQRIYPFDMSSWAPNPDYRENLIAAACFLVAEIERIDRQTHTFQDDHTDLPAIVVASMGHFKSTENVNEVLPTPIATHPPMPEVVRETLHRIAEEDPPPLIVKRANDAPAALKRDARVRHLRRSPSQAKPIKVENRLKARWDKFASWGKTLAHDYASGIADFRVFFM